MRHVSYLVCYISVYRHHDSVCYISCCCFYVAHRNVFIFVYCWSVAGSSPHTHTHTPTHTLMQNKVDQVFLFP